MLKTSGSGHRYDQTKDSLRHVPHSPNTIVQSPPPKISEAFAYTKGLSCKHKNRDNRPHRAPKPPRIPREISHPQVTVSNRNPKTREKVLSHMSLIPASLLVDTLGIPHTDQRAFSLPTAHEHHTTLSPSFLRRTVRSQLPRYGNR